jgi:hypothetical protein
MPDYFEWCCIRELGSSSGAEHQKPTLGRRQQRVQCPACFGWRAADGQAPEIREMTSLSAASTKKNPHGQMKIEMGSGRSAWGDGCSRRPLAANSSWPSTVAAVQCTTHEKCRRAPDEKKKRRYGTQSSSYVFLLDESFITQELWRCEG